LQRQYDSIDIGALMFSEPNPADCGDGEGSSRPVKTGGTTVPARRCTALPARRETGTLLWMRYRSPCFESSFPKESQLPG
jgi:hypothetical protein